MADFANAYTRCKRAGRILADAVRRFMIAVGAGGACVRVVYGTVCDCWQSELGRQRANPSPARRFTIAEIAGGGGA